MTAPRGRGRPRIGTRVVLTIPDGVLADIDAHALVAGIDPHDEIRRRLAARLDRWVSVGRSVDELTARYRHLVREGGVTSACGSTANRPSTWRANTTKPACPSCLRATGRTE